MKDIDNREKKILVNTCVLFVFFFFGLGLKIHYGPDIYTTITNPLGILSHIVTQNGRPVSGALFWLLLKMKLPFQVSFYVTYLEECIFAGLAAYYYGKIIILELKRNRMEILQDRTTVIAGVLSCLTVVNIFSAEAMLTPIWFFYMLSIFLTVMAVWNYYKYSLIGNKTLAIILPTIFLIIAVFIYQTNISLYIILTAPLFLINCKSILWIIKRTVLIGVQYSIAMLVQLLYVKVLFRTPRTEAKSSAKTITKAASTYAPKNTTPQVFILRRIPIEMWFYMAVCIIVGIVLIYKIKAAKEYIEILKFVYLVGLVLFISLLPYFAKVGADFKPRVYYPAATVFGVVFFYGWIKGYLFDTPRNSILISFFAIATVFVIEWLAFFNIFYTQYITDEDDRVLSYLIKNEINEYESDTGKKIE